MIDPKEKKDRPETVTNNPDEAITEPKDVEESNDERIDEDYPGYPHYPAKDDILNPENHVRRVDINVENLSRSHRTPENYLKSISNKSAEGLLKDHDVEEEINTSSLTRFFPKSLIMRPTSCTLAHYNWR